ncbi:hypothetical protein LMK05_07190 [Lactococcus petauri]|nr:hypothetical protein LMK05_07190 [Lactococcus petauri]
MGKTKIISLLVVLVVVIGGIGGYMFYHQKSQAESFTATENIMDKLQNEKSNKVVFVFYSNGSDYSKAGEKEVLEEAKKVNYPVYYVDVDSQEKGEVLSFLNSLEVLHSEELSSINAATLLSSIHEEENGNLNIIKYADQVDGKYVPLTDNIKKAFK